MQKISLVILFLVSSWSGFTQSASRTTVIFNEGWKFFLGDNHQAKDPSFDDVTWRNIKLPHDWSIEGTFSDKHPAGVGGGALPGGVGWYRKTFSVSKSVSGKKMFIAFDGVYCNSEVWLNGHYLGKRPNGYISFQYDITPFINLEKSNVITVRVDNSQQPNSRWYSGSGIYRNVYLITTKDIHVDQWGTFVQTPEVSNENALVTLSTTIKNGSKKSASVSVVTTLINAEGKQISKSTTLDDVAESGSRKIDQSFRVTKPTLWSIENPYQYQFKTELFVDRKKMDEYVTPFGVRAFSFDAAKGFSLNGVPTKIKGVCLHHDFGCLGAVFNVRAMERQLEIMKAMGVNAIRTSHNPPAPALLDLCDRMGFLVMNEAFDMWKREKNKFDYHLHWDEWHTRDLEDHILRDRNHPSVFAWSVGNEIGEQWDTTGVRITKELVSIVKRLDPTRFTVTANNEVKPTNSLIKAEALDLIGYNYNHKAYENFPKDYPGKIFIGTETTSALATRGHYDMPSDSIRRWPIAWDKLFTEGNADNTVSAYDNVSAPWGSTHEETWKLMKKNDFLSGMFIWTGFDYLGEPTPYVWPSRSSYFGVVDLAGFPKDVYYMYQSEWTNKPTLHIFPHWNWTPGKLVDVWAYYNQADEVELFLNNKSLGVKSKKEDELHVMWRIPFEAGTLKAVSKINGQVVMTKEIKTTSSPARVILTADRSEIKNGSDDLSFVTVSVVDADGNIVPYADNLVKFTLSDNIEIAGVDNGDPTSHDSFKATERKAFHGLALVVIRGKNRKGTAKLTATAEGLQSSTIDLVLK
ncbi:beta-galactosidase GalB [Pseudochryseolinea flava]|uniref:Glycoside hydrolase family 2 n=1 Tax=Pseudochryseolinea flava TaxID=2059302 RepID=A0A364Y0D2_9BACT|nr:beta-galactosidase GalB [Pseudochryseolinea flava]RAW00058.1 glycoside hydrolase family 2 [Pseudochryseolinea flava]